MGVKAWLEDQYRLRMLLVFAVFCLNLLLSTWIGPSKLLLVVNALAIVLTLAIWRKDCLLKIDLKIGYVAYYLALLAASIIVFPRQVDLILSLLYRNGFGEEVLFRFFMVGIFSRYNTANVEDLRKMRIAVLVSNLLFTGSHSYSGIGLVYIFVLGVVFTFIYVYGGLPSVIVAHALHNFYIAQGVGLCSLLLLVPLAKDYLCSYNLMNLIKEKVMG